MAKTIGKKTRVCIAMSGGVDSSVAAALLKSQGYDCIGAFFITWTKDAKGLTKCPWEQDVFDARRVCAKLDIPLYVFNFEKDYKKRVVDYLFAEYRQGRTPNPDIMCNKEIKFKLFLNKAKEIGADFIATGHYAQIKKNQGGYDLVKGKDKNKDQSYFLYTLNQNQLKHTLFPIGHLIKPQVRQLAKKFRLPNWNKKDSQGICFLGAIDLKEFLKHYIKEKRGKVLNERGEKIGYHNGVFFHTLGERHGFTITKKNPNDGAYYIIGKDVKKNILYVSQNPKQLLFHSSQNFQRSELKSSKRSDLKNLENFCLKINNTNWISLIPKANKNYTAQIRYHSEFLACKIKIINKTEAKIIFKKSVSVASGQSCVIYHENVCLGGGVVI